MIDFKVWWQDEHYFTKSKVYYIDAINERFLITDYNGCFHWARTKDCELVDEDEE